MEQPERVFYEKQFFRLPFMRLLVALPPALLSLVVLWQVILGHPWGRRPMSNAGLVGWTMFLWLVYLHLVFVRFVTEVRPHELLVSMRGVWRSRRITLTDIRSVEVTRFNPTRDFRGYGIRATRQGTAYIAGGNEGVRLELTSGATVIIGSQRAEELAEAIRRLIAPQS